MPNFGRGLSPADKCLLVVFSRDLALAGQSAESGQAFPWIESDLTPTRNWNVVGIYDFLKFHDPGSLNEISHNGDHTADSHRSRLVIFPFEDEDLTPPQEVYDLLTLRATDEVLERHPWVIFGSVHFSAVVHECNSDRDGETLKSLRRFIGLWQQLASKQNCTYFFGCLGSPDLVVISFPENPDQLNELYRTYRKAHCLTVDNIKTGKLTPPRSNAATEGTSEPGHGCMSVMPIFAFHGSDTPVIEQDAFKSSEHEIGIQYHFRLRVRCGHERQVAEELRNKFPLPATGTDPISLYDRGIAGSRSDSETQFDVTWDQHMVRGYFRHFENYKRIWKELWFEPNWRTLHLLNSHSAITLPDDAITTSMNWPHNALAWKVEDSVYRELIEMHSRIDKFSAEILNSTQRAEMLSLLGSYYACFFRQDLIGAARDLFPFFQQLSCALSDLEAWRDYLEGLDNQSLTDHQWTFDNDMRDLFVQVGRAIRNRIEHRTTVGDPPFPHTFREGSSKTISAYSVIVYLCWEMFRRTAEDEVIRVSGSAENFAACVHSGTDGRVICIELFSSFRNFLLSREEKAGRDPAKHPWHAKLLAFDFSGRSLLRPEHFIAHSLHEVAEFADWLDSSHNKLLCEKINVSIGSFTHALLKVELARYILGYKRGTDRSPGEQKAMDDKADELKPFLENFMDIAMAAVVNPPGFLASASHQDIVDVNNELQETISPVQYADLHSEALRAALNRRNYVTEAGRLCMPRIARPPQAEAIHEFLAQGTVFDALESWRDFLSEVLADAGMWCGLYSLLTRTVSGNLETCVMSEGIRQSHVNKVFMSILLQCEDFGAQGIRRNRLFRSVVARWRTHYAAVSFAETEWEPGFLDAYENAAENFNTLREHRDYILHGLTDYPDLALRRIMEPLREFVPYGGRLQVQMGRLPKKKDEFILGVFDRLWNGEPCTSDRIDLIMRLWATSTHFAIRKLVVPRKNGASREGES